MADRIIHEIRFGLIKCEIGCKPSPQGDRYSVKFVRLFRNGDKWQESGRFSRDDLPLVAKIADLAHTWIYFKAQNRKSQSQSSGESNDE
jgi:hypothetical protein